MAQEVAGSNPVIHPIFSRLRKEKHMGLRCGIVGLPNVGKSTLFNALTNARAAASNFPFCTIDPNIGVVGVPDPRLYALSDIVEPEKTIPTSIEIVDIAGLVKELPRERAGETPFCPI